MLLTLPNELIHKVVEQPSIGLAELSALSEVCTLLNAIVLPIYLKQNGIKCQAVLNAPRPLLLLNDEIPGFKIRLTSARTDKWDLLQLELFALERFFTKAARCPTDSCVIKNVTLSFTAPYFAFDRHAEQGNKALRALLAAVVLPTLGCQSLTIEEGPCECTPGTEAHVARMIKWVAEQRQFRVLGFVAKILDTFFHWHAPIQPNELLYSHLFLTETALEKLYIRSASFLLPPLYSWTLQAANNPLLTTLSFAFPTESAPASSTHLLRGLFSLILPSITLPVLADFTLSGFLVEWDNLAQFLARHPTIIGLTLLDRGDASENKTYPSYSSYYSWLPVKTLSLAVDQFLPVVKTINASPTYLNPLLALGGVNLHFLPLVFDISITSTTSSSTKHVFTQIDDALTSLAHLSACTTNIRSCHLTLSFPSVILTGSAGNNQFKMLRNFLNKRSQSQASLHSVTHLELYTAGKDFLPRKVFGTVARWLAFRFPRAREVVFVNGTRNVDAEQVEMTMISLVKEIKAGCSCVEMVGFGFGETICKKSVEEWISV